MICGLSKEAKSEICCAYIKNLISVKVFYTHCGSNTLRRSRGATPNRRDALSRRSIDLFRVSKNKNDLAFVAVLAIPLASPANS